MTNNYVKLFLSIILKAMLDIKEYKSNLKYINAIKKEDFISALSFIFTANNDKENYSSIIFEVSGMPIHHFQDIISNLVLHKIKNKEIEESLLCSIKKYIDIDSDSNNNDFNITLGKIKNLEKILNYSESGYCNLEL